MRILLTTRVHFITAVVILGLFIRPSESNPERGDRDRKHSNSNNGNLGIPFHHDDHLHEDDPFGHPSLGGLDPDSHLPPQGVCEPIKVGLCMGIGYNHTTMPNLVGHDAQADADALLQTFSPLIQYGCSPHLKLFLCSAYVPMCTDKVPQPIGPCQSLCESVRGKCEPVLKEFGFAWPPSLECSKFYTENNQDHHLCNPGPSPSQYSGSGVPKHNQGFQPSSFPPDYPPRERYPPSNYPNNHKESPPVPSVIRRPSPVDSSKPANKNPHSSSSSGDGSYHNNQHNQNPNQSPKAEHPFGGGKGDLQSGQNECTGPRKVWARNSCWTKCTPASPYPDNNNSEDVGGSSLFHPSEKQFARTYALLWAVLSLSAALIALTLSVCSPHFSIVERPILYIAICQVLFSIGVIIGVIIGSTSSCFLDKSTGIYLLAKGHPIPSSCALVFLLTYFFSFATNMWWVILCLTWLLSLNRDMAASLLQKEWSLFHLVSWGMASILTSTALIHGKVDADELTGICGVGYQDPQALSFYNLIPLSVSLSIGLVFLIVGLAARIFFPDWNLPVCKLTFLKRRGPTSGQNRNTGCELSNNSAATTTASHQTGQTHTNIQNGNNFRAPHGYSPVLVLPPHPPNHGHLHGYSNCNIDRGIQHHQLHHGHGHQHGHCSNCMGSNGIGPCSGMVNGGNNNNGFYSTGNSPASVVGVGGFQRLRALENTKAIWMRIGIFALVHSLPIACQVGTMAYELAGRDDWEKGRERPNLQIFLLRLNMNLIAGLTTGVWILSTYSWSWTRTIRKLFHPQKTKAHPHDQKVVSPLLNSNPVNLPLPVPSGSSSSSNNHNSTMPILGTNNTFTVRGALAAGGGPRNHFNFPLPPVPSVPPRTDAWRRGETIV